MRHDTTTTTKGPGVARGPALITGALLAAFGLLLTLKAGDTPTSAFPGGTRNGPTLFGFETNGWTAWFTITAGCLLLFGAARHLLAKTVGLFVGLALGACSVIALVDRDDVLGLAAANGPVKLGWGTAAGILLITTLLPRAKRTERENTVTDADREARRAGRRRSAPGGRGPGAAHGSRPLTGGPVNPDDEHIFRR